MYHVRATALLVIFLFGTSPAIAQDPFRDDMPAANTIVTVALKNGLSLTGTVDQRTTDERLWLRFGTASAQVSRPLSWTSIQSIHHGERSMTPAEVQNLAEHDDGTNPPLAAQRTVQPHRIVIIRPAPPVAASISRSSAQPSTSRPTSLRIDAGVANFNADTENDGLVVELMLLDQQQQPVPFTGTARIVWLGPQLRSSSSTSQTQDVVLGDWNTAVASQPSNPVARLELPFQCLNPERDNRLANYSLVQVTLTIPGVGNFAAELDGVRVRRWEPNRDFQQLTPTTYGASRSSRR